MKEFSLSNDLCPVMQHRVNYYRYLLDLGQDGHQVDILENLLLQKLILKAVFSIIRLQ